MFVLWHSVLSAKQNIGAVCAFEEKCGDIKEFPSKEEAVLAGYKVAHCGPCANCSTWNDMELQWSTKVSPRELAVFVPLSPIIEPCSPFFCPILE